MPLHGQPVLADASWTGRGFQIKLQLAQLARTQTKVDALPNVTRKGHDLSALTARDFRSRGMSPTQERIEH